MRAKRFTEHVLSVGTQFVCRGRGLPGVGGQRSDRDELGGRDTAGVAARMELGCACRAVAPEPDMLRASRNARPARPQGQASRTCPSWVPG
jgi:hypothetical protein